MSLDSIFESVHNAKRGHWGIDMTYKRANIEFPGHGYAVKDFHDKITTCIYCQKYRFGMRGNLEPMVSHLKVPNRRTAIGVDVLTVTPTDAEGNVGLLVIVVFFSKLVYLHCLTNYTSLSVAEGFMAFYSLYGLFEEVHMDPGSNLRFGLTEELHRMLGMKQVVSIVDRHESNGVEGTNGQVMRHLRLICQEERIKDKWGKQVPLISYFLNSHVQSEASDNLCPFDLHFGSKDSEFAKLFFEKLRLGDMSDTTANRSKQMQELDLDLAAMEHATRVYQATLVKSRVLDPTKQNVYQPGDMVLHHLTHRVQKLDSHFCGPFDVIVQTHNDVECRHISSGAIQKLHVTRLKPFFGTREQAYELAIRDNDQFVITEILSYIGLPETRGTLEFEVKFGDGDVLWVKWSLDLFKSLPYETFCKKHKQLFPILFTLAQGKREIKQKKDAVDCAARLDDVCYLNLRSYGELWYQRLAIPDTLHIMYALKCVCTRALRNGSRTTLHVELFNHDLAFDNVQMYMYVMSPDVFPDMVVLDVDFIKAYPAVMNLKPVLTAGKAFSSDITGDGHDTH